MATYLVHFTSTVQGAVPIEAESEQEAIDIFDNGGANFEDMLTVYSETGSAEFAELEEE